MAAHQRTAMLALVELLRQKYLENVERMQLNIENNRRLIVRELKSELNISKF